VSRTKVAHRWRKLQKSLRSGHVHNGLTYKSESSFLHGARKSNGFILSNILSRTPLRVGQGIPGIMI